MKTFSALLLALCLTCLLPIQAEASVVIMGTRVILPAEQGQTTVRLTNEGKLPALVETWIDAGDPHATPNSVHTPFLITPPLFRLNPAQEQNLRILFLPDQQTLPKDRETVFWLNVLEIPPRPTGVQAQSNLLQLSIRSRLKLFYRPAGLKVSSLAAPSLLTWQQSVNAHSLSLTVHNPSPYYITLTDVTLTLAGKPHPVGHGMVAPFSDLSFTLNDISQALPSGTRLTFHTINDSGASNAQQGVIAP